MSESPENARASAAGGRSPSTSSPAGAPTAATVTPGELSPAYRDQGHGHGTYGVINAQGELVAGPLSAADTDYIAAMWNAGKRLAAHLGVDELALAKRLRDGGLVWLWKTVEMMVNTVRPLASAHNARASHDYAVAVEQELAALKEDKQGGETEAEREAREEVEELEWDAIRDHEEGDH